MGGGGCFPALSQEELADTYSKYTGIYAVCAVVGGIPGGTCPSPERQERQRVPEKSQGHEFPPLPSLLNKHFLNTCCGPGPRLGARTGRGGIGQVCFHGVEVQKSSVGQGQHSRMGHTLRGVRGTSVKAVRTEGGPGTPLRVKAPERNGV